MERFVTLLGTASLMGENADSEVYDELRRIIRPITLQDILRENNGQCHSENPDSAVAFRACIHQRARQTLGDYNVGGLDALLDVQVQHLGYNATGGRRVRKSKKTRKHRKSKTRKQKQQKRKSRKGKHRN